MKGLIPRAGQLFAATAVLALLAPSFARAQAPAGATAICGDGSYSSAATKRGACSGHGGIKTWLAEQKSTPAPKARATPAKAAPATAPTPAGARPANATGICADGSYTSAKSARGACSGHGGVKSWITPPKGAPVAATPPSAAPPAAVGRPAGVPERANGQCADGAYTAATSPRGACSGHGGVKVWYTRAGPQTTPPRATPRVAPSPMAAPQAQKPRGNAPVDAANATALCNDGTYSASQHRGGTCSRHGGVKQWLKDVPK